MKNEKLSLVERYLRDVRQAIYDAGMDPDLLTATQLLDYLETANRLRRNLDD